MKYRTKLYISLVAVAFASIIVGLVIFSTETEKLVLQMLRSRSLSIAATAAAQLDSADIEKIKNIKSSKDPNFNEVRDLLRNLIRANQRSDIYVENVYTLHPDAENNTILRYGVEGQKGYEEPGSVYRYGDKDDILKGKDGYYVNQNFTTDQYGVWLSAFAPIRDKDGNYVATLGVDINASDVHRQLEQLIKYALLGLSCSFVLALLLAFILAKTVTASLDHLCAIVKEIGEGNFGAKAELITNDEFGELSRRINDMSQGLQERERLKMSFARYVSHHVMEDILKSETPLKLEGERKKVTILFSDIRQFTQLAERLPPEEVVHLLNEYFEEMIEVIFTYSGTLDKFIGDGMMVEFGAPLDDQRQEEHAIQAAIAMQKALHQLNLKWSKENRSIIEMGIGIHTGEAILGNVGSERRIEYTAIGDAVNVSSRLEQATKILDVGILISESTYLGAKDRFLFKDLGTMALPGRKEQIQVYTLDPKQVK